MATISRIGREVSKMPVFCLFLVLVFGAVNWDLASALEYSSASQSAVPLPPGEAALPASQATHLKNIHPDSHTLEGSQFDNEGNLYFCDVSAGKILKLDPQNHLQTIAELADLSPSGLSFHPDGRLFVAGNSNNISQGAILAMRPDGTQIETILPREAGFIPNDLVINSRGGIYFTDFRGNMTDPGGGVYYLAPGAKTPRLLIGNIANANGIALSPDEKTLWVGDYGRSILFRIVLTDECEFNRIHSTPVYYFTGRGPDSMRVDSDGNLYIAIMSQGRALAFNPVGIPIGQVLLPGRDQGKNLFSASVAINPLNGEMIIVARDDNGGGANLFKSQAFAKGLPQPISGN